MVAADETLGTEEATSTEVPLVLLVTEACDTDSDADGTAADAIVCVFRA